MTRLLASEIRRLTSRRLVRWSLVVALVLVILLVAIVTARSDRSSLDQGDAMRMTQLWLTSAAAASLGVNRDNSIVTISILMYLLVIVIGASAVGAEYRAGTVGTILTWEPRRIRLLVARLAAAGIVAMLFFLIVHAVFVAAWALGVALNGSSGGADADFWRDLLVLLARATLLAGALAVISGAITTLVKNTGGAMGIWFGYLIAVEGILRGQVDSVIPWFLTINVGAFYAWETVAQNGQTVTAGPGGLRVAWYVVLLGGAALAGFQRRDVT
jgi:ABC-type transport system involved in multi-copper enzyme maturation permease subunit